MVRHPDDLSFSKNLGDGALDRLAGRFVDDRKNLVEGPADRFLLPTRQLVGDLIHQGDAAFGIGDDDRIADAGERGSKSFPLLVGSPFRMQSGTQTPADEPMGEAHEDQTEAGGEDSGDESRRVTRIRKSAAILEQPVLFFLDLGHARADGVHLHLAPIGEDALPSFFKTLSAPQVDGADEFRQFEIDPLC